MKNSFGNYVVQKALKISKGENKKKLIESAGRNLERLGEKKIIEKWKNILSQSDIPSSLRKSTHDNNQNPKILSFNNNAYYFDNDPNYASKKNFSKNSKKSKSGLNGIPNLKPNFQNIANNPYQFISKSGPTHSQNLEKLSFKKQVTGGKYHIKIKKRRFE